MKKIIYILFTFFWASTAFTQCFPDRHNTSWFDGWISCEATENPNSDRAKGNWIAYDFGKTYALKELKIWNINDPDLLNYGAKDIVVDYSIDGRNWLEAGTFTLPKATGKNDYEGELLGDLGEIKANHVLITVLNNYGGECTGFAELRFSAELVEDENADVCIIADVYPNPIENEFSVFLSKKCLGDVYLAVEDAMGKTVIAENIIKLYETKTLSAENLRPGVYFVCLRNGEITERYKIVKL